METIADFIEWIGEDRGLALGGLLIGAAFGFFAQRSQFCLRAAVIEVARARFGPRLAVWLLAFSAALLLTQSLVLAGEFDTGNVRQLASQGSLSGAAIGGLLFGIGMVLARELKLEGFQGGHAMRRYIAGALLMGFGGMLAGGCAVGAGVSGAAVFALTAWVTLSTMWLGASLTDWLVDREGAPSLRAPAAPSAP